MVDEGVQNRHIDRNMLEKALEQINLDHLLQVSSMKTKGYIRLVKSTDLPYLFELEQACFSVPWSLAQLTSTFEQIGAVMLIYEQDDQVIGYLSFQQVLDEAMIHNVAVLPHDQGQGIAKRLLSAAISLMPILGLYKFMLEVRPSNLPARAAYQSVGFSEVGRRKDYYHTPTEDALLMDYVRNASSN